MRGMAHDVGGALTNDPIPHEAHAFAPWEVRVDALMWLLTDATRPGGPHMVVDELRRGIESLPRDEYRTLGYYAKWLLSMIAILGERGIVDPRALDERAAEIARERGGEHAGHVHP